MCRRLFLIRFCCFLFHIIFEHVSSLLTLSQTQTLAFVIILFPPAPYLHLYGIVWGRTHQNQSMHCSIAIIVRPYQENISWSESYTHAHVAPHFRHLFTIGRIFHCNSVSFDTCTVYTKWSQLSNRLSHQQTNEKGFACVPTILMIKGFFAVCCIAATAKPKVGLLQRFLYLPTLFTDFVVCVVFFFIFFSSHSLRCHMLFQTANGKLESSLNVIKCNSSAVNISQDFEIEKIHKFPLKSIYWIIVSSVHCRQDRCTVHSMIDEQTRTKTK